MGGEGAWFAGCPGSLPLDEYLETVPRSAIWVELTLDAEGVKALAALPSLDELRGKLVGLLVAPATKIAGIMQAPAGQLARVIGAYSNKEAA